MATNFFWDAARFQRGSLRAARSSKMSEARSERFFFGAATSAHQVEGGNHNDWTEWEQQTATSKQRQATRKTWLDFILKNHPNPLLPENYISGRACDHYNRFREDFDIAKQLGHNAHRFSIEWSRIEPEEGKFNEKELEHYKQVVRALRKRGMEPFVTLWHWTLPIWLSKIGGLENKNFPYYFARYARHLAEALKDDVFFWTTLNEPTAFIRNSLIIGVFPPQKKSVIAAIRALWHLVRAHREAHAVIHSVQPKANVGFSAAVRYIESMTSNPLNAISAFVARFLSHNLFIFLTGNTNDYLAIQYYSHSKIGFPARIIKETSTAVSDIGWEIYPEGIYHLLKIFAEYGKPIYVTENGVADARDAMRGRFITDHIFWIRKAMKEGADVRGYFHWSLLDNFEWDKGFWPRFGLVEVDYKTLKRKIRPSALIYKKIIEAQKR